MTKMNGRQLTIVVSTLGLGIIVFILNLTISVIGHEDPAVVWRAAGWTLVLVLFMVGLATIIVASQPLMLVADRDSMRAMRQRDREPELPQSDSTDIKRAKAYAYVDQLSGTGRTLRRRGPR